MSIYLTCHELVVVLTKGHRVEFKNQTCLITSTDDKSIPPHIIRFTGDDEQFTSNLEQGKPFGSHGRITYCMLRE
jgi:hypothetical protein